MQKRAGKYADSEEAMAKVTAKMLKAFEGFFPKHNKALQTYRAAVRDNKDGAKAKAGKEVGKLRTGFLKEIAKLNKELDKVEALTAKLEEKVKQEEAEDAAEGGGEE
jgi:glucuronate isomerase